MAQLIAVSSVGAYRITVATHGNAPGGEADRRLAQHLRACLAVLASGLDPAAR
jgi:hypothetical protein